MYQTRSFSSARCASLAFMATDHILALLVSERNKITRAIEALQGPTKRKGRPRGSGRKAVLPSVEQDSKPPETVGPTAAKRKMSAAGRRAIIAGTKKHWAAVKAAKAAALAAATPKVARAKASGAANHKTSSAKDAAFRKKK